MSRSEKGLMSAILSDPDKMTISSDFVSAEPTVISHYSGDKNYRYAAFDGVGKEAYYNENGILMLDDTYLMAASINPVSKVEIKEAFNTTYGGVKGFEQWAIDKEVIKDQVKPIRKFNKIAVLGTGYGMGPKKLVSNCYDAGYVINFLDSKKFNYNFWNVMFPDLGGLRDYLSKKVKREGFLVNPFGFRMQPSPHKALNYFIQSSVSGMMNIVTIDFLEKCPYVEFRTIIHDELIFDCPENRLVEAQTVLNTVIDNLNKRLNWSVDVRTGWESGKDWYAAH